MAIHAKANGLLVSGKVICESGEFWVFKAMDEKRPKEIKKSDQKNRVFDGENAVEDAIEWQLSMNNKVK